MQEIIEDKVSYIQFKDLQLPSLKQITLEIVKADFESKDWKRQFQALTNLRKANKYYGSIFLQQLFPQLFKTIISQIHNLRSNNSKQALTLVSEIIEYQNIEGLDKQIIWGSIDALFSKAFCEKTFIKNEALKAINVLPKKLNEHIISGLNIQTLSQNGNICELAIKTVQRYLEQNVKTEIDEGFLKALCKNMNGKRALVQRTSKQILDILKIQKGAEQLQSLISSTSQLTEQESITLRNELKRPISVVKNNQSFKDFIKKKKSQKQNL